MNNNTSYETQAIDLSLLSVLDITKEGKVVSVEKWVELWTLVFQHINKIDAFCVDMQATLDNWHASEVALNEIIEDMQMKYASLSTGFTHYGEAPPQNPHIKFWVRRMEDIATHCFITNADIDILFNPESPNAQSGIAVAEALSGYVVAEVGKGLSSNDFTNEDKEKLYSALQNENVDQTYNPESTNAQSGKAVAEAVAPKMDNFFKSLTVSESGVYASMKDCLHSFTLPNSTGMLGVYIQNDDEKEKPCMGLFANRPVNFEGVKALTVATPDGSRPTQAANVEFVKQTQRQAEAYANKTFASAVRNTSSGDLVKVSDVSPIEHELDVKITSKKVIENKVDISQLSTQTASDGTTFTNNGDGTFTITTNASNFYFTLNKTLQEICPTIQGNDYVTFYFEAEGDYDGRIGFCNGPETISAGDTCTSDYKWSDYAFTRPSFYMVNGSYNGPVTIKNFKIGTETGDPVVEDLTTVSVTAQGKNILPCPYIDTSGTVSSGVTFTVNNDGSIYAKGTSERHAIFKLGDANNVHLKDGVSYVVGCGYANRYIYLTYKNEAGTTKYWGNLNFASPLVWSDKYTLTSVNIQFYPGEVVDMTLYPQIEIGEVATEYEPYREPFTVSANADGTVKGLMSISPTMKLMTDTADVTIDLVYNADTKMYIDNKLNELATALLNA